jgi:hypothetical protein
MYMNFSSLRKRHGATLAGVFSLALSCVVLLCGAGSVPIENLLPQGALQGDLNAGGHNLTNAATVSATNVVVSGSLTAPSSFTLAFTQLAGTPTTLGGYGITDPVVLTSGSYANPSWLTSLAYAKLSGAPSLATVATSGSYTDLSNKPVLGSLSSASPGGTASSTTFLKFDGTTYSYAVPPGGSYSAGTGLTLTGATFSVTPSTYQPLSSTLTSLSGLTLSGTPGNTTFLRGDGAWSTMPSSYITSLGANMTGFSVTGGVLNLSSALGTAAFTATSTYDAAGGAAAAQSAAETFSSNAANITSGLLAVARGGTGTNSPSLIGGTNVVVTGSWPNQTINSSGGSGGVSSFNTRTGAVALQNSDLGLNNQGYPMIGTVPSGSVVVILGDSQQTVGGGTTAPGQLLSGLPAFAGIPVYNYAQNGSSSGPSSVTTSGTGILAAASPSYTKYLNGSLVTSGNAAVSSWYPGTGNMYAFVEFGGNDPITGASQLATWTGYLNSMCTTLHGYGSNVQVCLITIGDKSPIPRYVLNIANSVMRAQLKVVQASTSASYADTIDDSAAFFQSLSPGSSYIGTGDPWSNDGIHCSLIGQRMQAYMMADAILRNITYPSSLGPAAPYVYTAFGGSTNGTPGVMTLNGGAGPGGSVSANGGALTNSIGGSLNLNAGADSFGGAGGTISAQGGGAQPGGSLNLNSGVGGTGGTGGSINASSGIGGGGGSILVYAGTGPGAYGGSFLASGGSSTNAYGGSVLCYGTTVRGGSLVLAGGNNYVTTSGTNQYNDYFPSGYGGNLLSANAPRISSSTFTAVYGVNIYTGSSGASIYLPSPGGSSMPIYIKNQGTGTATIYSQGANLIMPSGSATVVGSITATTGQSALLWSDGTYWNQ